MNKKLIKELAISMAKTKTTKETASFVLKRLTKEELKDFLFVYKNEINKNKVTILSASILPSQSKEEIESKFANKDIFYEIDDSIGGGIKVRENDVISDFTFKNIINQTISALK